MELKKYRNNKGKKHKKTTLLWKDGEKEKQENYPISIA